MSPEMGVYDQEEAAADIAVHAALPTVHQDAPALVAAEVIARDLAIANHAALAITHVTATAIAETADVAAEAAARDAAIAVHAALATVHQDAPALIATHTAIAAAHHAKYTDAEADTRADAKVATHTAIAAAHHAKTTSFADITDRAGASKLNWTAAKLLLGAGAGANPTEIDVPTSPVTTALKTADEIVNNSTALQDDNHLLKAVLANEVYLLILHLICISSTATPGIKYAFSVPVAATIFRLPTIHTVALPTRVDATAPVALSGFGAVNREYWAFFIYKGGANAGNIQLQWAQNTATVEDTKVVASSSLIAVKLG